MEITTNCCGIIKGSSMKIAMLGLTFVATMASISLMKTAIKDIQFMTNYESENEVVNYHKL